MLNLQQLKQKLVNTANSITLLNTPHKKIAIEVYGAVVLLSAAEGASQGEEPAQATDIDKTIFNSRTKEQIIQELDEAVLDYLDTIVEEEACLIFFSHSFTKVIVANGLLKDF